MKINYVMRNGRVSTAYLDDQPDPNGPRTGTDKYTEQPITVYWADTHWAEATPLCPATTVLWPEAEAIDTRCALPASHDNDHEDEDGMWT